MESFDIVKKLGWESQANDVTTADTVIELIPTAPQPLDVVNSKDEAKKTSIDVTGDELHDSGSSHDGEQSHDS